MRLPRHISGYTICCIGALVWALPAHAQLAREDRPLAGTALGLAAPPILPTETAFAQGQMRNSRVYEARLATRFDLKRQFEARGIRYPAAEMFIRIFKRERALELWVRPENSTAFELLKTYDICALAGELGPKRRQGDNQVPEGFYSIDFFNPQSEYLLSLHVDYPNARDYAVLPHGADPGGDIYIHGGCSSVGCLAITNDGIRELYWMAVEARSLGQQRIPVHIFPARLEPRDLAGLERVFADQPALTAFWRSLKPGYDFFEQNRRLPAMVVNGGGEYELAGLATDTQPLGAGVPGAREAGGPTRSHAPVGAQRKRPLGTPVNGN